MFAFDIVCEPLQGTPLYNAVLRLSGMRVGRNVCWLGEVCTVENPTLCLLETAPLYFSPGCRFHRTQPCEAVSYVFEVSGTLAKSWAKDSIELYSRTPAICSQLPC